MANRKEGAGLRTTRKPWSMDNIRAQCDEVGECLLWNQAVCVNGYPRCHCDGATRQIRPYVYAQILGKTIRPGHRISTKCGSKLCLSPECLVMRSNRAIGACAAKLRKHDPLAMQRCRDGAKRAGHAKFDNALADEIRNAPGSRKERAERYGCDTSTIGRIDRGDSYGTPPIANSVFSYGATL